jgi:hypothetical protein
MPTERLDDLHEALLTASNKLNEAVLGLNPIELLLKTNMWQWGTVQEAQERVTDVMEKIEWVLRKREYE